MKPEDSKQGPIPFNKPLDENLVALDCALLELLNKKEYTEFELIRALQSSPYNLFSTDSLSQPLSLFQTHFVLFNALYRIKTHLNDADGSDITISALKIAWHRSNAQSGNNEIQINHETDEKLATYYLDWQNFKSADEQTVNSLLNSFWEKFLKSNKPGLALEEALTTLNIDPSVPLKSLSKQTVKSAYKSLSLRQHPDKGGDKSDFQKTTAAYHVVLQYL